MTGRRIEQAMKAAIEEAEAARAEGEFPYGAVIIDATGAIIARTHDMVGQTNDPTRHAEIDAVKAAIASYGPDLTGCTLVCTGEPCSMCSSAAWWSGIRNIVFSVSMKELKELVPESMTETVGPIESLNNDLNDKFISKSGIMREQVLALWGIA